MSKVVVIEDEPFILMMIEDKLKRAGIEVVALKESVNAVDVIRKESPDLVLMDWMMPEISGLEVCEALKADDRLRDIPIFMLSAKGQEEDIKRGLESGVAKYLTKPFSPKALLEIVEEELARRK
ncbi:MAG: response regulator [Nitrospirota bacterium]|jgi:two-component system phosphate regulon response regulator PhoB